MSAEGCGAPSFKLSSMIFSVFAGLVCWFFVVENFAFIFFFGEGVESWGCFFDEKVKFGSAVVIIL